MHREHPLAAAGIAPEEVFLARPAREGSEVLAGGTQEGIVTLMRAGLSASEAVLPKTDIPQIALFERLPI